MVNGVKIKRKLPSLLIEDSTGGFDPLYQHKRNKITTLQRKEPQKFSTLFNNVLVAIDELDKAAEQAGFMHIGLDEKGNIIRKEKNRNY